MEKLEWAKNHWIKFMQSFETQKWNAHIYRLLFYIVPQSVLLYDGEIWRLHFCESNVSVHLKIFYFNTTDTWLLRGIKGD